MNNQIACANSKHLDIEKIPNSALYSVAVPKHAHQKAEQSDAKLYNLRTDVVLQCEVLPQLVLERLYKASYFSLAVGFTVLLVQLGFKLEETVADLFKTKFYAWMNLVVSGGNLAVMLVCTVWYIIRVLELKRGGFVWSKRRRRQTILNMVQLTAHSLNCILQIIPNVVTLVVGDLAQSSLLEILGLGRYTLWNICFSIFVLRVKMLNPWVDSKKQCIGRDDAIIMDAPWVSHWPFYLGWVGSQCFMLMAFTMVHFSNANQELFGRISDGMPGSCIVRANTQLYVGFVIASLVVYQIIGFLYIYKGCWLLKKKPYNLFRLINIKIRYHFVHAAIMGNFVILSMIVLFWVRQSSCETVYLTLLGLLPAHVVMTGISALNCIMDMPVKPGKTITLSLPTDYFRWLEEKDLAGEKRPSSHNVAPKFCFELSVKLWYWSMVAYSFDPVTQECHDPQYPLLSFPVAMNMFGLQHHEFIVEKGSDTRILIAWNDHTILVCFRGTYSATNVLSDLQSWRVVHPPKRGNYFMRSQPLVHRGFFTCWSHSNLDQKVLAIVKRVMDGDKFDRSRLRVLVTGHSMGGSIGALATYDLATNFNIGNRITCYTYGSPRAGNHAFVRDYNKHVPDTWQVVNDEDPVPSIPKFLFLYKHVGMRVIINGAGDMIVNPNIVEVSLYRICTLFEKSVKITQHLLLSYRESFVAICEAQYKHGKALKGGKESMETLLANKEKLLSDGLNVDPKKLQDLHDLGSSIWLQRRNTAEKGDTQIQIFSGQ